MIGREAITYATLYRAKRQISETLAQTLEDQDMRDALVYVTQRIDRLLPGRAPFIPIPETVYVTARPFVEGGAVWGYDLILPRPLLEVTTLTNGDGTVIAAPDYTLHPRAGTPYGVIRLPYPGYQTWMTAATGDPYEVIAVQGVWGNRRDYADAWLRADSVQDAGGISATVQFITVADADGTDAYARAPRFSPGQLLKIGGEFLALLDVDYLNNELRVLRGALGTTAAAHAEDAPIDAFEVEPTIQQAAAVWAAYAYVRRGHFEGVAGRVLGVRRRFPKDIPPEVEGILGLEKPKAPAAIRIGAI